VTVAYDLERACVVWVEKGKARETIERFFNQVLSDYQKKRIEWACCDMSETFIGAIKDHCPNADLVLDRFHRVQPVARALLSHLFSKSIIRCIAWIQAFAFPFDSKTREFVPYAA
jgi:transposase